MEIGGDGLRRVPRWRAGGAAAAIALLVAACGGGSDWEGGIHARMAHSPEVGVRVVGVPPEGPAARAGIEAGDRILAIDGEPVEGLTAVQVAERLRGRVGEPVELRVDRAGRSMTFVVDRAPYE